MEYCRNTFKSGTKEWFMFEAYREARVASRKGECPIGAVIVKDDKIIARAHNNKESKNNPLGHAEVLAIKKSSKAVGSWRLNDCDMYVTLEPCAMCAGALVLSRMRKVYIGTKDKKSGAVVSVLNILDENRLNHSVEYHIGMLEDLCSGILTEFFRKLRKNKKKRGEVSKWS